MQSQAKIGSRYRMARKRNLMLLRWSRLPAKTREYLSCRCMSGSLYAHGGFSIRRRRLARGFVEQSLGVDIQAPLGEHLVTIVALGGGDQLFPADRPEVEKAADYIAALEGALTSARQGKKPPAIGAHLLFDVAP